jgi:hypothetical protein
MLRIPLCCDGGGETTVLAHLRRAGVAGVGQKPNDLVAIRACGPCHDRMDRRTGLEAVPDEYVLDALVRTLDAVVREGLVSLK